jgi:hypothetical protein
MILGDVPHAVGAGAEGHWLLAFGAPHMPVDHEHRMTILADAEEALDGGDPGQNARIERAVRTLHHA